MTGPETERDVVWLDDVGLDDVAQAGGKGANLGELIGAGLHVPGGFVVTAGAYRRAADVVGVRDELAALRNRLAVDDPDELRAASEALTAAADKIDLPDDLAEAVLRAYREMGPETPVAVRSSATAEDAGDTSFAGMHTTYTWVRGDDELLARVRDCWGSLYGARVVSYRASQGLDDEPAIAVVVQRMVDADRAGVAFTADPSTGDLGAIVVEAAFGLGEPAVVVTGHGHPVGVVTIGALTGDATPGTADAHVADVMDYEVVRIDPGAGERETLHAFREAAWLSLRRRHPCALGE